MTEDEILKSSRRNGQRQYTQFTITRLSDMKENLRLIRQRGYAVDHQESNVV